MRSEQSSLGKDAGRATPVCGRARHTSRIGKENAQSRRVRSWLTHLDENVDTEVTGFAKSAAAMGERAVVIRQRSPANHLQLREDSFGVELRILAEQSPTYFNTKIPTSSPVERATPYFSRLHISSQKRPFTPGEGQEVSCFRAGLV